MMDIKAHEIYIPLTVVNHVNFRSKYWNDDLFMYGRFEVPSLGLKKIYLLGHCSN